MSIFKLFKKDEPSRFHYVIKEVKGKYYQWHIKKDGKSFCMSTFWNHKTYATAMNEAMEVCKRLNA